MRIFSIIIILFSLNLQAREYRGEHKTKVWCTVSGEDSAKDCMKRLAAAMPSENDDNAVFLAQGDKASGMLQSLIVKRVLISRDYPTDFAKIDEAKYFGIVIQNDDEESIYYYAMKEGLQIPYLIANTSLSVVDAPYDVCEKYDPSDRYSIKYPEYLRTVTGWLLGNNYEKDSIYGTAWFNSENICDEL